jgi:hypothetical protein
MDLDEAALVFIVEYYELLQTNRSALSTAYADGARILLYHRDKPLTTATTKLADFVPAGHRTILHCTGETVGPFLYVHVLSHLATPQETKVLDESFTLAVNQSILIVYHSIHVGPFLAELAPLPPPKPPAPAAPPKPEKEVKPKPQKVEVSDPNDLNANNAMLIINLPFKTPGEEYIRVLERFGAVVKFAQTTGKMVVEFADRKVRNEALHTAPEEWNGREPRYRPMAKPFTWDPPKRS